jgi:hypothetical protein
MVSKTDNCRLGSMGSIDPTEAKRRSELFRYFVQCLDRDITSASKIILWFR